MNTENKNIIINNCFHEGWQTLTQIHKEVFGKDHPIQHMMILYLCNPNQEFDVRDILKSIHIKQPNLSAIMSRMEKNGLLIRKHNFMDGRKLDIEMTIKGIKLRERFEKNFIIKIEGITKVELKTLQKITNQIQANRIK